MIKRYTGGFACLLVCTASSLCAQQAMQVTHEVRVSQLVSSLREGASAPSLFMHGQSYEYDLLFERPGSRRQWQLTMGRQTGDATLYQGALHFNSRQRLSPLAGGVLSGGYDVSARLYWKDNRDKPSSSAWHLGSLQLAGLIGWQRNWGGKGLTITAALPLVGMVAHRHWAGKPSLPALLYESFRNPRFSSLHNFQQTQLSLQLHTRLSSGTALHLRYSYHPMAWQEGQPLVLRQHQAGIGLSWSQRPAPR